MNTLIVMMGLPRSGKSSWTKAQGHPIVEPDAIRLAMHGQVYVQTAEPFVWATARTMVNALFISGHDTVIIDATHTRKHTRDSWKSEDYVTKIKLIDTPAHVCIQRAIETGQEYLESVIERMVSEWEPLEEDELIYTG